LARGASVDGDEDVLVDERYHLLVGEQQKPFDNDEFTLGL
jgi:hypothetical protein